MRLEQKLLHSYGHNSSKKCEVLFPSQVAELRDFVASEASSATFSIKGAGNSFGDVFLPESHSVIDMSGLNRIISFNPLNRTVTVEAGVHVGMLQQYLLESGFYLPSCSGAIDNTVAGDASANINGKDSWKHGHYFHNILSLDLLDSAGEIHSITNGSDEAFLSIIGGLGLIGIIVSLTMRIEPVQGSMLSVSRATTGSLAETVSCLVEQCKEPNDFAYAWVDPLAKGKKCGRGVVESSRFVQGSDDNLTDLLNKPDRVLGMPDDWFWNSYRRSWNIVQNLNLHEPIFRIVNATRYQFLKRSTANFQSGYFKYQFPMMSTLPNWNKRFVKRGMQEIHCIFNELRFETAVLELWGIMSQFGLYPELAALRKHKHDDAYLSFSADGLSTTLSYDRYGQADDELYRMERKLVETVIKHGGKIYLAKFPYITSEELRVMYPKVDQFLVQKKRFDPENRLVSSASARLFDNLT
ncbi:MAG: FAD-binding protein [Flavobacteriales bacterium]|nr:FAD-binding protein [Flavobacteriales bacterium]